VGQAEISEILIKNYPKYLDYKDIIKISGYKKDNVIRNLRKVRIRTECEVKVINSNSGWQTLYRMKGETKNE